jgi:hypothetical protein
MIPTQTIPSLSGTFGIPAKLALSPKMPKEPSSPSRSNARIEKQSIKNETNRLKNKTRGIKHWGLSGYSNILPRIKFGVTGQESSPQSPTISYRQPVARKSLLPSIVLALGNILPMALLSFSLVTL